MEAPEKIYLYISPFSGYPLNKWYAEKQADNDVGYTRTDAFIEKACEGIENLLSGYIIRNFHFGDSYDMDKLIEDFRRYMKGE